MRVSTRERQACLRHRYSHRRSGHEFEMDSLVTVYSGSNKFTGASLGRHTGVVRRINRQINKYVKSSVSAHTNESEKPPPVLVKLSDYRVQRSDHRAYDGFHLNGNVRVLCGYMYVFFYVWWFWQGYAVLSLLMFDVLAAQMRAVEWRVLKGMLASQGEEPISDIQTKKDR